MTRPHFRTYRYGFHNYTDAQEWVQRESSYFAEQGATYFRVSIDPNDEQRRVVEGWLKQPDVPPAPKFEEPKCS